MTLRPGDVKGKDPASVKFPSFNFDAEFADGVKIASSTVTVSGPDDSLVADGITISTDGRSVNYRLTGGTLGADYDVTCQVTTDETPAQTDKRSLRVRIMSL